MAKVDFALAVLFAVFAALFFGLVGEDLRGLTLGLAVAALWSFASRATMRAYRMRWWLNVSAVIGSIAVLWFDAWLTGQ
jgi:hypothetical protein